MDHQAPEPSGAVVAQPSELSGAVVAQPSAVPAAPEGPAGWSTDTSYWHSRKFSETYRSASKRAWIASVGLGLVATLLGLMVMHDLAGFGLIDRATTGLLTNADAAAFDGSTRMLAVVYVGSWIVTAIAFLAWLSRTVDNVPSLGGGVPGDTPRWSIAWWFVPFANVVKPYLVVRDLGKRLASPAIGAATWLIVAWWLTLVGGDMLSFAIAGMPLDTIDQARSFFTFSAIGDALTFVAAVLAILVVRHIQRQATVRAVALTAVPDAVVNALT